MSYFGPTWNGYIEKIQDHWVEFVKVDDLVLIPGDISWAMTLEDASLDLTWIHNLPGTKLLLKGNHDYWWSSSAKMAKALPPSIRWVHNNTFSWEGASIGGSRLWDTEEYGFTSFIEFQENPKEKKVVNIDPEVDRALFTKELERLARSLEGLEKNASMKIAMTHYPPIGADLAPSAASAILEKYAVDVCVFGHLHNVKEGSLPFGSARGVRYVFASADYLQFKPILIRS